MSPSWSSRVLLLAARLQVRPFHGLPPCLLKAGAAQRGMNESFSSACRLLPLLLPPPAQTSSLLPARPLSPVLLSSALQLEPRVYLEARSLSSGSRDPGGGGGICRTPKEKGFSCRGGRERGRAWAPWLDSPLSGFSSYVGC